MYVYIYICIRHVGSESVCHLRIAQGTTSRWALAWSFEADAASADERASNEVANEATASEQETKGGAASRRDANRGPAASKDGSRLRDASEQEAKGAAASRRDASASAAAGVALRTSRKEAGRAGVEAVMGTGVARLALAPLASGLGTGPGTIPEGGCPGTYPGTISEGACPGTYPGMIPEGACPGGVLGTIPEEDGGARAGASATGTSSSADTSFFADPTGTDPALDLAESPLKRRKK